MNVRIHNSEHFIGPSGKVLDHTYLKVPWEITPAGRPYVWIFQTRRFINEIVLEHHGEPPHSARPIRPDEIIRHKDGNILNCHIDNLEYFTPVAFERKLNEAVREEIVELLKSGRPSKYIIDHFAASDIKVTPVDVSRIKKESLSV